MRLTLSAVAFFGLSVALFQDLPAQGQTQARSILQLVPTPNQNSNSELLAASASSPNDIWVVGQSTIHFDGTTWTAFPAPIIKGDNNSFLQGVAAISPTLASVTANVTHGAHPGQVIEQWNGAKWNLLAPQLARMRREFGGKSGTPTRRAILKCFSRFAKRQLLSDVNLQRFASDASPSESRPLQPTWMQTGSLAS